MLPLHQVLFTASEGLLDQRGSTLDSEISDTISLLNRHGVPWILCTERTRAEIEPLRRKLEHAHPFLSERGSGVFIPDGYFNLRLDNATRVGRYFCVPFARSAADSAAALNEIAQEAEAEVVGLAEMTVREIARNIGLSQDEAERYKQREFGETFFFAGETEDVTKRFSGIAAEKGWQVLPGEPLWEIRAPLRLRGHSPVPYLMNIYRKSSHARLRSAGIGIGPRDSYLLSATDVGFVLPSNHGGAAPEPSARVSQAIQIEQTGSAGWRQAVMSALDRA